MEIKEAIRSLFQEIILPEFEQVKAEQSRMAARLDSVDQRIGDINLHLVDQSRRIDAINDRIDSVRDELVGMIQHTNQRIDETNKRLDRLYEVIVRREEHHRLERVIEELGRRVDLLERKVA